MSLENRGPVEVADGFRQQILLQNLSTAVCPLQQLESGVNSPGWCFNFRSVLSLGGCSVSLPGRLNPHLLPLSDATWAPLLVSLALY